LRVLISNKARADKSMAIHDNMTMDQPYTKKYNFYTVSFGNFASLR